MSNHTYCRLGEDKKGNKIYQLYSGKDVEIPNEVEYFYYNMRSGRILAYHNMQINGMNVVSEKEENNLRSYEKVWLANTKRTVALKELNYINCDTILVEKFIDIFEKELQKEVKGHNGQRSNGAIK